MAKLDRKDYEALIYRRLSEVQNLVNPDNYPRAVGEAARDRFAVPDFESIHVRMSETAALLEEFEKSMGPG